MSVDKQHSLVPSTEFGNFWINLYVLAIYCVQILYDVEHNASLHIVTPYEVQ